jgi:hypothetical protein
MDAAHVDFILNESVTADAKISSYSIAFKAQALLIYYFRLGLSYLVQNEIIHCIILYTGRCYRQPRPNERKFALVFKELRFCSQTHSYSSPRSRVYQIAVEKQGGQTHSQLVSVHTPRLFFQYDSLYYMRDDVYMKRNHHSCSVYIIRSYIKGITKDINDESGNACSRRIALWHRR